MKTSQCIKVIWFFLLLSGPVWAKQITQTEAQKVALQIVNSRSELKNHISSLELVYECTDQAALKSGTGDKAVTYYYVYNAGENNGFVIIAGDDIAYPVIGYSNTGSYDKKHLPANFVSWMEGIQSGIRHAIENELSPSEQTEKAWKSFLSGNGPEPHSTRSVSGLIQTKWGQDEPYNNLCPPYRSGVKSVTGCVATVMAQLMKYHRYPQRGKGKTEAYTTETNKISIPAIDLSVVQYNWSNMTNVYTTNSSQAEKNAVATIMYHCGAAVQMDYGEESGAYIDDAALAMIEHFNYDAGMQMKSKSHYSDNEWTGMLRAEFDAGRPVYYSGSGNRGGHAFICDGYDLYGLFSFNWGWEGYMNGYFNINGIEFNRNNTILIGIKPNEGGTPKYEMKLRSGTELTSSKSNVKRGETFTVSANFCNAGLVDFTGSYGVVLLDNNGRIVETVGIFNTASWTLEAGYYYENKFNISCKVQSASDGNYKIRAAVKPVGGSWMAIGGEVGYTDELSLKVGNAPDLFEIRLVDKTHLTSSVSAIKQGEDFTVTAHFRNTGEGDFDGYFGIVLLDERGIMKETIGIFNNTPLTLESGYRYTDPFRINCNVLSAVPGNYKIRAAVKPTEGEWITVSGTAGYEDELPFEILQDQTNIDLITDQPVRIFILNDQLHISGPVAERITIYSTNGALLYTADKPEGELTIPLSHLAKGVLIIRGSSGWKNKVR